MKSTQQKYLSILILTLTIFSFQNTHAQDIEKQQKNSLFISYGNIIFSSQISFSYERVFLKKENYETRAKLNYGKYLSNNYDYETNAKVYENHLSLSAVHIYGILEINAGLSYSKFKLAKGEVPDPTVDYMKLMNEINFYGNLGIRYSKDNFLIRAGLGNLELLYIGMGLNF